jgi:hypothetical protein
VRGLFGDAGGVAAAVCFDPFFDLGGVIVQRAGYGYGEAVEDAHVCCWWAASRVLLVGVLEVDCWCRSCGLREVCVQVTGG